MKKVLVVAQFTQLPGEEGNNRGRFKLICEMLTNEGYDVTVITSRFRELDRTFRKDEDVYKSAPYKIIILDEVGYYKNISLRRIYSMWSFNKSLKHYLKTANEKYDLVYTCVPGLDSAMTAGKFARKNSIPFVIDVQDIWPEAMYDLVLDVPVISDVLFFPLQFMANKVYSMADGIMAVSQTYLEVAKKKSTKSTHNDYVFIGTDIDKFDREITNQIEDINKPTNEFWITYIGSLGHSYDLYTFIEGVQVARENGLNVRPIILGSGPLENDLKDFAKRIGSNALFTGWVDHATMGNYLKNSDAVVNAIKRRAPQSITNKIGDYLSSGRPILNGSLNLEFLTLINQYNFGINYEPENVSSLSMAISNIYNLDEQARERMGLNARRVAEEKFDRRITYQKILRMVGQLT